MRVHTCLHELAIDCVSVHECGRRLLQCVGALSMLYVWCFIACAAQISMCTNMLALSIKVETQRVGEERQNRKTVQKSGSVR